MRHSTAAHWTRTRDFDRRTPVGYEVETTSVPDCQLMDYLFAATLLLGLWAVEVVVFLFSYRVHSRG